VSLRMFADLRLSTAQQRTTGQTLQTDLCYQGKLRYMAENFGIFRYKEKSYRKPDSVHDVTISEENENVA
jgi:hypothetical protein